MNRPHLEGCPNIDCHNNKDCCPFRKIVIPSVMGGDSEGEDYAPENGAYRNALVEYESNGHIYMYSSDGIPTRLTGESGGGGGEDDLFYINVTNVDFSEGTFTADKTYAEILEAYNAGKLPIVIVKEEDSSYRYNGVYILRSYGVNEESDGFDFAYVNATGGEGRVEAGSWVIHIGNGYNRANESYGSVEIDNALSQYSNHAVKNSAVYEALSQKVSQADLATVATSGSYNDLSNKPSINGHELIGNKTAEELGITSEPFYVYCIDTQPGDPEPSEGVYIYKDASYTVPMTAGEILDAYRNGDRVVFATNSPFLPSPDSYTSYVYNELVRASVTYANGTSQPVTRVRFYIMNNRAGADVPGLLSQACWAATSLSDTWLSITRVNAQARLTAGDGITISGNVISATGGGGGGATMFYADLRNAQSNLGIYTDSSQSDIVDSFAMIDALSRGPVMIKDMNDNNIFVTVVSGNGSSGLVSIVIDMYDDQGEPATRRFEFVDPDWVENPF